MTDTFDIFHHTKKGTREYLGYMPISAISFNRYNQGLLVAAGSIFDTTAKNSVFLKFSTMFRDHAYLEFRTPSVQYEGNFCFINFDEEDHIVVFGSVGPITEKQLPNLDLPAIQSATLETAPMPA